MNGDGTNLTQLTNHPGKLKESPVWSPDGTKIAYAVDRTDIYVINADGSNPVNITDSSPSDHLFPCWSPDGSKIGFTSSRDGEDTLYIMNSDGSNPQRVNGPARSCEGWFSTATATQVSPQLWGAIKSKSSIK
jgi:Tol biopolymer transport system component